MAHVAITFASSQVSDHYRYARRLGRFWGLEPGCIQSFPWPWCQQWCSGVRLISLEAYSMRKLEDSSSSVSLANHLGGFRDSKMGKSI